MMRPARLLLLLAIGLVVFGDSMRADTYPRQAGIDAQHYAFKLTLLTGDSNEIAGEATVRVRKMRDDVREVVLDLATPTADGKGMAVTNVSSGAWKFTYTHRDNRLILPLPQD